MQWVTVPGGRGLREDRPDKKEKKEEMLAGLPERTWLLVRDFEVLDINFLIDCADIRITYSGKE